jgi:hypothetical protein
MNPPRRSIARFGWLVARGTGRARGLHRVTERVVAVFRMERGLGSGRVGFCHVCDTILSSFEQTRDHCGWMCAGKASRSVGLARVYFTRVRSGPPGG